MKKIIRVGLIGTGKMAHIRAAAIAGIAGIKIVVVGSEVFGSETLARSENLIAFAKRYAIQETEGTHVGVIENHDLDAVIICTTAPSHCDLIELAVKNGVKYIFCEKPFGVISSETSWINISEVDRVLNMVEKEGVHLQIGFNRRFDPDFLELHEKVANGCIGEMRHLDIVSLDPAPPSAENLTQPFSLITETKIHDLDMATFFGGLVEHISVVGFCSNPELRAMDVYQIDSAVASLVFESGATCITRSYWGAPQGYLQQVTAHGTSGLPMTVTNATGVNGVIHRNGACLVGGPALHDSFADRYERSYVAETEAFLESVRNEADCSSGNGDMARQVSILVDAAIESVSRKGVAINPIAGGHVAT